MENVMNDNTAEALIDNMMSLKDKAVQVMDVEVLTESEVLRNEIEKENADRETLALAVSDATKNLKQAATRVKLANSKVRLQSIIENKEEKIHALENRYASLDYVPEQFNSEEVEVLLDNKIEKVSNEVANIKLKIVALETKLNGKLVSRDNLKESKDQDLRAAEELWIAKESKRNNTLATIQDKIDAAQLKLEADKARLENKFADINSPEAEEVGRVQAMSILDNLLGA